MIQKGFPLGWGRLVVDLIVRPCRMAWGLAILADMYHELHEVVYHGGSFLGMWSNASAVMGMGAHCCHLTTGSAIRAQPSLHLQIYRVCTIDP